MPSIRELIDQGKSYSVDENGLLNLEGEDITSLEGLAAIHNIERVKTLDLSMNDELRGTIEGLGQMCPQLENLRVFNTKISSLNLKDCTQLREVRASDNYFLKDITEIKLPASVTVKDFNRTGVSEHFAKVIPNYYENFAPWATQPQPTRAFLAPDRLTGMTWVESLPNGLTEIDASFRDLDDSALRRLIERFPNVEKLDASQNHLQSLDVSGFHNLRELRVSQNDLESIDLSGCHNIMILNVSANPALRNLDVSGLQNLLKLYAAETDLESLDLSECHNLQELDISENPVLRSLNVSGLQNLRELSVYQNYALTSLDLSECHNLLKLNVYENPALRSLNVSGLHNLCVLDAAGIGLESLDVSGLQNLRELNVSDNGLESLDVSGLQNLSELNVIGNSALTSLNASGCHNLQDLLAILTPALKPEGLSQNILERLARDGSTDEFAFDISQADAQRALEQGRYLHADRPRDADIGDASEGRAGRS